MDLILFLVTAIAGLTNTVGINDQLAAVFKEARAKASLYLPMLHAWMCIKIAKPLSSFMLISAAMLLGIVGLASYVHFDLLEQNAREQGIYTIFLISSLLVIGGLIVWAVFQRIWGHERYELGPDGEPREEVFTDGTEEVRIKVPHQNYKPRRVRFFVSVFMTALAFGTVSITLSMHALYTESRALWLISMLTRYIGLVVVAVVLGIVAWIIKTGGSFVEKFLQTIVLEPLAALVPGVTLKNVTSKLFPNGLNLIEEQKRSLQVALAASALALIVMPFDLAVFVYPTTMTAIVVGGAYIFAIFAGWCLRQIGRDDIVDASTERLLTFLFKGGPVVMALVLLPLGTFLSTSISNGLKARWSIFGEAVSDVIQGRYILVDYRHWYHNFGYVAVGGIALAAVLHFMKLDKESGRIKKTVRLALCTLFGYATFIGVFGILVNNFGFLNTQERYENNLGWTAFSPNVARHEEQLINVQNLVASTTDTSIHLTWQTDAPADCRIEIKEIKNPQGQLVDGVSGLETDDKGRKFLYAVSRRGSNTDFFADINNLSRGWIVTYRVWTKHISLDKDGQPVKNPNEGMWPAQDPKWENTPALPPPPKPEPSGPIGPTGPTGSAAAPSASASASAAPGKAAPAPRKGGKALPKLPAPGATTASAPAPELSTVVSNMRASIDALKKKDR